MACYTCDHTMRNVGFMGNTKPPVPLFWCPRCGTLSSNHYGDCTVPTLVEHANRLANGGFNSPQERARIRATVIESTTLNIGDSNES